MTAPTKRRTRKAPAAIRPAPDVDSSVAAGALGFPVTNIAGVDVEIRDECTNPHTGQRMVGSAWFPVHGAQGSWAGVVLDCLQPIRYRIGWGGWQHDTFPTMEAAIKAVLDPTQRKRIEVRTAHERKIEALDRQVRELRAEWPEAPTEALEHERYHDGKPFFS